MDLWGPAETQQRTSTVWRFLEVGKNAQTGKTKWGEGRFGTDGPGKYDKTPSKPERSEVRI